MKRVAVFGNAGGGKSTLARELAAVTGLPLHVLDKIQFRPGRDGVPQAIPYDEYLHAHAELVSREAWIIDGFGCARTVWERLAVADTLIHVDLPLATHALWVTKRLVTGLFVAPAGWPDRSPVISSSIQSYRVLWSCHRRLTPKYRSYVASVAGDKRVVRVRSGREAKRFLEALTRERAGGGPAA